MRGKMIVPLATLLVLASTEARAGGWQSLHQPHKKLSREMVAAKMKSDGIRNPASLLAHRYLVRLAIRKTGGGPAAHSEVAVRFRVLPEKAVAKAWSDRGEKSRAQLGGYSRCKVLKSKGAVRSVGRTCPVKYNGRGFVDVTKAFTERNILFVHDPGKPNRANSIVWVATDEPQKRIWYYVIPGARKVRFGFGELTLDKYEIDPAAAEGSSGGEETSEKDEGSESGAPPTPPPARSSRAVRPSTPSASGWEHVKQSHRPISRAELERRMRADGVPNPRYLLEHPYIVRFGIANTGGGSSSYSELKMRFNSRPKRAVGKAWADRNDLRRAQLGAATSCRRRSKEKGALKRAHWCPVHFNGLGWRELTKAFTSTTMLFINDPNNTKQGGMLIWAAFDQPQSGLTHRVPSGLTGPSFGLGTVKVAKFRLQRSVRPSPDPSGGTPQPRPDEIKPPFGPRHAPGRPGRSPDAGDAPARKSPKKWKPVAKRLVRAPGWKIMRYVRRDRLPGGSSLLRYPYVVRIQLKSTGGGTGRRSELGFRFNSPIAKVYGKAWADSPQMGRAQIGPPSKCRAGMYEKLPPGWRTCPMHFNNLGWRNLSSAVAGKKKLLLINQPAKPNRAHTVLWLAFRQDPGPILVRRYKKAGRYSLKSGRLYVWRVKVQRRGGRRPPPPGGRRRGPGGPERRPDGPGGPLHEPFDSGDAPPPSGRAPADGYEGEPASGQPY